MPFRLLRDVSVRDVNDDARLHRQGDVIDDTEVSDFVKGKIKEGSLHYRGLFEPLTDDEAKSHREKETAVHGDVLVNGNHVSPPWKDYIGLHATVVIDRMKKSTDRSEVERVRMFEKGYLARTSILEYQAPVERPPFYGYDDMGIREVLAKMEVLSDDAISELKSYEFAHRKRAAIISWEREPSESEQTEKSEEKEKVAA